MKQRRLTKREKKLYRLTSANASSDSFRDGIRITSFDDGGTGEMPDMEDSPFNIVTRSGEMFLVPKIHAADLNEEDREAFVLEFVYEAMNALWKGDKDAYQSAGMLANMSGIEPDEFQQALELAVEEFLEEEELDISAEAQQT